MVADHRLKAEDSKAFKTNYTNLRKSAVKMVRAKNFLEQDTRCVYLYDRIQRWFSHNAFHTDKCFSLLMRSISLLYAGIDPISNEEQTPDMYRTFRPL